MAFTSDLYINIVQVLGSFLLSCLSVIMQRYLLSLVMVNKMIELIKLNWTSMKNIFTLMAVAIILSGCAAGPADYNDKPNGIQRAEVVSKNPKGITVEHSTWGKKIAFRFADEHCATFNKVATYLGSSSQHGPDVISTWRCE